MTSHSRLNDILRHAKDAAIAYHDLTGKPLGITGEIGECIAAELLGLQLCGARTAGYDATDRHGRRIQIKCRRILRKKSKKGSQRIGSIRFDHLCDAVILVLLDDGFEPVAIYEAAASLVRAELERPGSKARNERGALSVSAFRRIAKQRWPEQQTNIPRPPNRNSRPATSVIIEAREGSSFQKAEHDAFVELVRLGGEVSERTLRLNVPTARCLVFLREGGKLVGVAALKRPLPEHRASLRVKTGTSVEPASFPFELGYIFVVPEARGHRYSRQLVDAAIQAAGANGMFATTRSDNIAMQATLIRFGFTAAGRDYDGRRQRIQLFLRPLEAAHRAIAHPRT